MNATTTAVVHTTLRLTPEAEVTEQAGGCSNRDASMFSRVATAGDGRKDPLLDWYEMSCCRTLEGGVHVVLVEV